MVGLPKRLRWLGAATLAAFSACDGPSDPDPVFGTLQVTVVGLPDAIASDITLTGPNGYSVRVGRTQTFGALVPGSYTIAASQVVTGVATFAPAFQSLPVSIGANAVSAATVIYSVTTGSITVTVGGAPPDAPWKVVVSGPAGFRDSVSTNRTLGNLVPGLYSISATEIQKGLSVYAPKPAESIVSVTASTTPAPAAIGYVLVTGTLAVHVNGLPAGVNADVSITGPNAFSQHVTGSITLEGLRHGRYELVASPVGNGSGQYTASPAVQSATVVPGSAGIVTVNHRPNSPPPGVNLAIEAIQLQQVVQTYGGSVPSIAGRAALLRVFVRASEPNGASPTVRVRLYEGIQQIALLTIPAPAAGVPTVIDEGSLLSSWNVPIDADLMRPGLRLLADVDPENSVAESMEADNTYPSSGTPLTLDVRAVPPLAVRLVPVTQSATGLTGNVSPANLTRYFTEARRLLPVGVLTLDIREPYTTNAAPLQPNDANGAWVQVLSELNALRAAEGTTAHYYGVVKVPYTAGVAGISYLPSFVSLGWDTLPHGAVTMVHELGHNFGRVHSNSCGAGGVDGNYPYAGGVIGVHGYDFVTGTLLAPSTRDIMGYCNERWISDYTYTGILAFRATPARVLGDGGNTSGPGLLIWGRIGPGGPVLEPAFEVNAPAKLPSASGPHRLEVLDASGQVLVGLSFRGDRTVDAPGREDDHFAFVIPLESLGGRAPARLRVVAGGRRAEAATVNRTLGQLAEDFEPVVQRLSESRVRLLWKDSPGRGVLVRDAASGAILTFARGGRAEVTTTASRLDLTLSDGVRSGRRSIEVR